MFADARRRTAASIPNGSRATASRASSRYSLFVRFAESLAAPPGKKSWSQPDGAAFHAIVARSQPRKVIAHQSRSAA
jgi:hypothetical protein